MREALARNLGKSIQAYRIVGNLSREQLAAKVNISRQAVAYFEDGKQLPSLLTLYGFAAAFNIEAGELLPPRRTVR